MQQEEQLRDRIAGQLMQQQMTLPQLSMEMSGNALRGATPRYSGSMSLPAPGGEVGLEGRYRAAPRGADAGVSLQYRRSF
jgi:hypothetical protein